MEHLVPDTLLKIFTNNDTSQPIYFQIHVAKSLSEPGKKRLLINDSKWCVNGIFKPNEHQKELENFKKFNIYYSDNYHLATVNSKNFIIFNTLKNIGDGPTVDKDSFQNLEHYLKDHPEINKYEKSLNLANTTTNNNHPTTTHSPSPSPSTNPQSTITKQNNNSSTTPTNISSKFKCFITIDQISAYQTQWSIKARVSFKGDIKTWSNARSSGKLFSFNLMDETGQIKVTCFNAAADKYFDIIQENKAFYITKARVGVANKKFSNLSHACELTFENETILEPCEDEAVAPIKFNFVKLNELANLENNAYVDVLGIIKEVGENRSFTSKATGKEFERRDIVIVDETQTAINVGLWNKTARDFNLDVGTPIAIRDAKINEFNGKQLTLVFTSIIVSNPNVPEAYKLKGWYDKEGSLGNYTNLRSTTTISNNLSSKDSILERLTIKAVNEQKLGYDASKPDFFTLKASVSFIRPENFSYPACSSTDCSKKVIQQSDGTWRCEKCSLNFPTPNHRYIMTASILDETGQMWINLFNEQAQTLIGVDANKLLEIKEKSPTALKNYLNDKVLYKEYAFRIKASLDSYNGQDRVRFQVLSLSNIDPSIEADVLAEQIDKFNF